MFKKIINITLVCGLLLILCSCKNNNKEIMKGVFEELTKESSTYMQNKKIDTYTTYSEKLDGNTITINASGEYLNGSWDYVLDGDYITYKSVSKDEDDYDAGVSFFMYIVNSVGKYLKMDDTLYTAYVSGISSLNMKSKYLLLETKDNTSIYKIYVKEKYDMKELDSMYIKEDTLMFEPVGENNSSYYMNVGKINFTGSTLNGELTFYIGEYKENTDLSYKSIINTAKSLKPSQYEQFVSNYTKLEETKSNNYEVTFLSNDKAKEEVNSYNENYKYIKVHFSK